MTTHKIEDYLGLIKALVLNITTGLITFTSIEQNLKIVLLLLSILYTSFKFYQDIKKSKKDENN